ncbi:37S ribosomal protein mrp21, mitochondrial [Neolecta irregularis DAH-3]|uniref:37S ribosomal protein mrp21, mitochondrial n=1 Tax=Neolecta irregularis (strain DAH-3) TaxID=1198029 RepID=A0A1U7LH11_NEOID|nr:37S ribosomal protein mrp21, mitochondrial [Neolecta irregularis DAH-3]|eukprot:OLL21945.1 37S ribosomal protein mrp21, mitochondrial [Neolecta irregularis DAH-3]
MSSLGCSRPILASRKSHILFSFRPLSRTSRRSHSPELWEYLKAKAVPDKKDKKKFDLSDSIPPSQRVDKFAYGPRDPFNMSRTSSATARPKDFVFDIVEPAASGTNRSLADKYSIGELSARETLGRVGPYAGRSVAIDRGDLSFAFRKLHHILKNNNVRQQFRRQKYYEKPSVKAKRLRSERHRKMFKEGVKRLVNIVRDMKRKGL